MKITKLKTLNETVEKLNDYSVIDHKLAKSLEREEKNRVNASKVIEDRLKDFSAEEKDSHTDIEKNDGMKKMHLAEALFEYLNDEDEERITELFDIKLNAKGFGGSGNNVNIGPGNLPLNASIKRENGEEKLNEDHDKNNLIGDVYNALIDIAFKYHKDGIELTLEDFEAAWEWFQDHFVIDEDEILTEAINGNTSHTNEFISTLRSAGFGDGFDQKLKIDTYGNGGTTISYKDQGGQFTVTITDDKVILEGQDEGDEPFKKEFTEWSKFVAEFNSLYPGIPVGEDLEDCQRYPVEGTK